MIARPGGIGAGARAVAIGFVVIGGCTSAEPSEPTGPSLDSGPADAGDARDARGIDAGAVDAGARDGGGTPDASPSDSGAGPSLRVLFVGNSYTRENMLPFVVRELAATTPSGPTLEVDAVLVDGATLGDHWTSTGALDRIRSGAFDVVVIQGQSTEPLRNVGFHVYADALAEEAVATGARVVWFVTWARRPGHPDYEALGLGTPEHMTNQLDIYYGRRHGIRAHVGIAFQIALAELPDVELYAADGSHPSAAGSLLAGCVLTQMIVGEHATVPSPVPLELPRSTADALCAIAPRVACLGDWTFCDGACVWRWTDPLNCGACGTVCPGVEPCTNGVCGCPYPEQTACGAGRWCTLLDVDEMNCGECGVTCEAGSQCDAGTCACHAVADLAVPIARLTDLRPACVRGSETWQPECFAAAHEHCAALDCFDSGIGPISPVVFAPEPRVACVSGEVRATTYEALRAVVPECTGLDVVTQPPCVSAIHRLCVSTGAATGFGPVGGDDAELDVTCVPEATVVRAPFVQLTTMWPECDGATTRSGRDCAFASALLCQANGHLTGFGPVEEAGDDVDIVCLDE